MRISDWSSDVCSSDLDGWSPAAQFAQLASGRRVRVAGIVLLRQRPGTASGVIFSTIEDETGVANIVLWPRVFERFRKTVLTASLLGVEGKLQREGIEIGRASCRERVCQYV